MRNKHLQQQASTAVKQVKLSFNCYKHMQNTDVKRLNL